MSSPRQHISRSMSSPGKTIDDYLRGGGMDVYCDLLGSQQLNPIVMYRSDTVVAIRHTKPRYQYHYVIAPTAHIPDILHEASMAVLPEMFDVIRIIISSLPHTRIETRIECNVGVAQQSRHLHIHVVAGATVVQESSLLEETRSTHSRNDKIGLANTSMLSDEADAMNEDRHEESSQAMYAAHAASQAPGTDLSAVEARFIAECEPRIQLHTVRVAGISHGRQSRVSVLAYEREGQWHHVVWKRMGAGKGLTAGEATEMWARLGHYKAALESCGWKIPHLLYSSVFHVSKTESQIFSYEQFIPGGDGSAMLADPREPNFRKWHFVREVLRVLYSYPTTELRRTVIAGRELTVLPHGLDLKAANCVLERGTETLYFVDLFGPKELKADGTWRVYSRKIESLPKDNLRVVCATREGCILRFWRLARRLWEPEKQKRRLLTGELLKSISVLDPPREEFALIRIEIESDYPWLTELYSERQV